MKKVRKNQWIESVIYSDTNLLLVERKRPTETAQTGTTVFICDGKYLQVGEVRDGSYIGRCVMWNEAGMYWNDYEKYFDLNKVRVVICYPKFCKSGENQNGLEETAYDFAKYISEQNVTGNVLLIGHGKGGLIMYKAATILPYAANRQVTVMTISTPFRGTPMADSNAFEHRYKRHFTKLINRFQSKYFQATQSNLDMAPRSEFLSYLDPLPKEVNHIAFTSTIDKEHCFVKKIKDKILVLIDEWCAIKGDGIMPFESQNYWPGNRKPEVSLIIATTYASSMETVLKDFGEYAETELFFSKISALQDEAGLESIIGELFKA